MPRREIGAGNQLPYLIPPDEMEVHILMEIGMALCLLVEYYCFKMKMTEKCKPGGMNTFAKHSRQKWNILFSFQLSSFFTVQPSSPAIGCQPFWPDPKYKRSRILASS
jgi:hypothetical protein